MKKIVASAATVTLVATTTHRAVAVLSSTGLKTTVAAIRQQLGMMTKVVVTAQAMVVTVA